MGHVTPLTKSNRLEQSGQRATDVQRSRWALRERLIRTLKNGAKTVLPRVVTQELMEFRKYRTGERLLYLRIRFLKGIGLKNRERARPRKTARSFLFVCFGNIIRSPMCEALLIRALRDFPTREITVSSAGLNATPGRAAHPWAVAGAQDWSISLENHKARLLTAEMVDRADVIFVMDYQNQVQLLSRFPQASDKVFLLSAFAGKDYPHSEIHDPYYIGEEETRRCYKTLDACIQNLVHSLTD